MARKAHEDALGVAGAETIIGTGVTVKGNLSSEADIIIDGSLVGHITTTGDITLGVNAVVKGSLSATNVTIAGNLHGNIQAEGETTIRETGQVRGDISTTGLTINSGGIFAGQSLMQAPPQLQSSSEPEAHTNHNDQATNSPDKP